MTSPCRIHPALGADNSPAFWLGFYSSVAGDLPAWTLSRAGIARTRRFTIRATRRPRGAARIGGLAQISRQARQLFAHSGRIVAADAPAQSTDPVAFAGGRGGFPGGNTPHAPGALTECATFQAEPGANQSHNGSAA